MKRWGVAPLRVAVGDEIVTTLGLFGFVTGFGDGFVWVEVDEGVQIRVARSAIKALVPVPSRDGRAGE